MRTLNIDDEYRSLLPKQTDEERAALVESILADGCRDALIVDENDTIVDGHNRYEICMEHNVPFQTVTKNFGSRDEAIVFICKNQMGRRNMTPEQWKYALGKRYEAEKKIHGGLGGNRFTVQFAQNDKTVQSIGTAGLIATDVGVGRATVVRSGMFASGVDEIAKIDTEAKQAILSGKSGLTMSAVEQVAKLPKRELVKAVEHIKKGEGRVVMDALKRDSPNQNRKIRYCKKCGTELTEDNSSRHATRFCKGCDTRETKLSKAIRGSGLSREIAEAAQKRNSESRDENKTYIPQVDHAAGSLRMAAKNFAHQLRILFEDYGDVLKDAPEQRKAALSEAKAAIERMEAGICP